MGEVVITKTTPRKGWPALITACMMALALWAAILTVYSPGINPSVQGPPSPPPAAGSLKPLLEFSADYIYPASVYMDLVKRGGSLGEWELAGAPYYFPDLFPVYTVSAWLCGNLVLAIGIASAVLFIMGCTGWILLAARLSRMSRVDSYFSAALVVACLCILHTSLTPVLYVGAVTCNHGAVIMLMPWILLAILPALFNPQIRPWSPRLLAACVTLALLNPSDAMSLVLINVPLLGVTVLLRLMKRIQNRPFVTVLGTIMAAFCGGILVAKLLPTQPTVIRDHLSFGLPAMQKSAANLVRWTADLSWQYPLLTGALALMAGAVIAIAFSHLRQWFRTAKDISESSDLFSALSYFMLLSLSGMISSVILLGHFLVYPNDAHYVVPVLLGLLFCSVPLLAYRIKIPGGWMARPALAVAALAAMLTSWQGQLIPTAGNYAGPSWVRSVDKLLAENGLKNGIGNYWDAVMATVLSTKGILVSYYWNASDYKLQTYVANRNWFQRFPPEFILLNRQRDGKTMKRIALARFGEPNKILSSAGYTILDYRNNTRFAALFSPPIHFAPGTLEEDFSDYWIETGFDCREGFVWSLGNHTEFEIAAPKPGVVRSKIVIDAHPLVGKGLESQKFSISVNGVAVGDYELRERRTIEFPIPPGAFQNQSSLKLGFVWHTPAIPKSVGASDNPNLLAVAFHKIALE